MHKTGMVSLVIFIFFTVAGCSRKNHPEKDAGTNSTTAVTKPTKKVVIKTATPKVITVNDKVAKRSVDGRYYYDLEGHRYWRNNRDGKYYLFHRSMFDSRDFKAPGN